ncbi:procathepsin L-like [Sycon ciliatum]|uniref:procathepsin L-like n=1 Tax=Sycon ciliatum TaxID=27933 RepID=UPI0031F5F8D4
MKILVLLCLVGLACSTSPETDQRWQRFKAQYNKAYAPGEEQVRFVYFQENIAFIDEQNAAGHNYTLEENQFADLSDNEFTTYYLGLRQWPEEEPREEHQLHVPSLEIGDVPAEVDWRSKGYVTPIKNQGACGSCWAFSATGSLEGQHFKKSGTLVSLSEQNLVDCSTKEGDHGCGGGLMDFAFKYVEKNGGIDTEASYPYKAKNGKCKFTKADIGATCTGKKDIKRGNEDDLQQAVADIGPISVGIDASTKTFRFYRKGVMDDKQCSSTKLDHGVLAVGYGTDSGDDYWLVKNSWGKSWGMEGYVMMSRNKHNQCGIATSASYPLV